MFAILLAVPTLAPAQQRAADVVDLDTVQTRVDAPGRSAFGRVMDVMIGTLLQQHAPQASREEPRALPRLALDAPPQAHAVATKSRRPEPEIEITLGDRFALPPVSVNAVATQVEDAPE